MTQLVLRNSDSQWFTFCFLIVLLILTGSRSAEAQSTEGDADNGASGDSAASSIKLQIRELTFQDIPSLTVAKAQVRIAFIINNSGTKATPLQASQFSLTVNDEEAKFRGTSSGRLRRTTQDIDGGDSMSATLLFDAEYPAATEPKFKLTWSNGEQSSEVDLNRYIRTRQHVSSTLLGPSNSLAVVELDRAVDHMAVWLLTDEFKRLKSQGIDRVVLDAKNDDTGRSMFALRTSIGSWIASIRRGQPLRRFSVGTQINSPVQFGTFYFCISSEKKTVRFSSPTITGDIHQPSREAAIGKALSSAYSRIPVEAALTDLNHPEPGVRRAALDANIDRLTEQQLKSLLQKMKSEKTDNRSLIAEQLYRVPYAFVGEELAKLARDDDEKLAAIAIVSLVRSTSPDALAQITQLWHTDDDASKRQQTVVSAILKSGDHRFAPLIMSHVEQLLDQYSFHPGAEKELPSASNQGPTTKPSSRSDVTKLRDALEYLEQHAKDEVEVLSRMRLLSLSDPALQDVVVHSVLKSPRHGDTSLVRSYVQQRLPSLAPTDGLTEEQLADLMARLGPRGTTGRSRISAELLGTIRSYPDSAYTERLLEISKSKAVSGSERSDAFKAALGCASHEQMQALLELVDEYSAQQKQHLLRHLHAQEHPEWLRVAEICLYEDEASQQAAISLMIPGGPAEAIELVAKRLDKLRQEVAESGKLSPLQYRIARRLLSSIAIVSHPEARRVVNRCVKSPDLKLSSEASESIKMGFQHFWQSTPYVNQLKTVFDKRTAKDYAGALNGYTVVLENEPLYYSGYVSRGSLHMRLGDHDKALADLQIADHLNPEDPTTESIIAIALIRLGRIEEGITKAEAVMNGIPDLNTDVKRDAIYNAACVYARATEATDDDEKQTEFQERGLKLLRESVFRKGGFDDLEHFLGDSDLTAFHQHEMWNELVEKVRENEGPSE